MTAKRRVTPQKARACAFVHAGMDEVAACDAAGYSRPDTAASRLFKKSSNGRYADATVRAELGRLAGTGERTDELSDLLSTIEVPTADDPARAILWTIAQDLTAPTTARVQAASKLLPRVEYKHRDDMVEGEECPACGFLKGADGEDAAESMRRLLGIVA